MFFSQKLSSALLCVAVVLGTSCGDTSSPAGPDDGSYLTVESDPSFAASASSSITGSDIDSWKTAHSWGNHAAAGYLTDEAEPAFSASVASGITSDQMSSWDTAHSWGDHAEAGYLTTEADPAFTASAASSISSAQVSSWDTTYGWGNHAAAGYLKSEADPAFLASVASGITSTQMSSWSAAYSWGDHAAAGYLKTEADPTFTSSVAHDITGAQVSNWNAAHGWGDHAAAGYLKTEADPTFTASVAHGITGAQVSNWNAAHGWGDHAAAGYLKSEADPAFTASAAHGITSSQVGNWNAAYTWGNHASAGYLKSESDPSVSSTNPDRVPVFDGNTLRDSSIFDDGTRVGIQVTNEPAAFFQVGDATPQGSAALDASQESSNTGSNGTTQWQSFTPTVSGVLTRVAVYKNGCNAYSGTLRVFAGEGTGGALLHSQSYSVNDCSGWVNFNLSSPVPVVAGSKYTFNFEGGFGSLVNDNSGSYAGGNYYSSSYGLYGDWRFRTYIASPRVGPAVVVNGGNVGIGEEAPARALHIRDVMRLEPRNGPPPDPQAGDLYFDRPMARLRYYNGTAWVNL